MRCVASLCITGRTDAAESFAGADVEGSARVADVFIFSLELFVPEDLPAAGAVVLIVVGGTVPEEEGLAAVVLSGTLPDGLFAPVFAAGSVVAGACVTGADTGRAFAVWLVGAGSDEDVRLAVRSLDANFCAMPKESLLIDKPIKIPAASKARIQRIAATGCGDPGQAFPPGPWRYFYSGLPVLPGMSKIILSRERADHWHGFNEQRAVGRCKVVSRIVLPATGAMGAGLLAGSRTMDSLSTAGPFPAGKVT